MQAVVAFLSPWPWRLVPPIPGIFIAQSNISDCSEKSLNSRLRYPHLQLGSHCIFSTSQYFDAPPFPWESAPHRTARLQSSMEDVQSLPQMTNGPWTLLLNSLHPKAIDADMIGVGAQFDDAITPW